MKNFMLKVALLGDAAVGKTSLRRRFMGKSFQEQHLMTIGADFSTTSMKLMGHNVQFQIWDIAGEQNFRSIRGKFYRGVKGALCVFDITREDTFQNINSWISELWKYNGIGEVPIVLLGNKSDLRDGSGVPNSISEQYANKIEDSISNDFEINYLETSAKTGLNVEKSFELLGTEIVKLSL